ncbi:MAG TPA: YceI family protein [Puia sp.]|jgi:polyisoprenoid-binding protein YceI|nr:YceI family protein [Puia sp.]
MKKSLTPLLALILLAGSAYTFITAETWQIADGYSIIFSSDEASGVFKGFKGNIVFDEQNPAASKFDVTIDVASINTGNGLQNKHAKSDEWFDAAKYPQIRFISQKFTKTPAGYQVTGNLTLHGTTKPFSIPFTFKRTAAGGLFAGTFNVNRTDFQVGKPGGDVSDQIKLEVSVPVTK